MTPDKLLLAIAMLVAGSAVGHADKADDYMACLIGQSAVALKKQGEKKDAYAAQEIAYTKCKKPEGLDPDRGQKDFVDLGVQALADAIELDTRYQAYIVTMMACLDIGRDLSKQEQKGMCANLARLDKQLEAEGLCVVEASGTIISKEECDAREKACAENSEACIE